MLWHTRGARERGLGGWGGGLEKEIEELGRTAELRAINPNNSHVCNAMCHRRETHNSA